jgi:ABC-2 type transport system ATP-binding protein
MADAIVVRDLVKRFGSGAEEREVIHGINFAIPRGQVCALLGPNGAGKTTTMQMLLGLTRPTSGSIEILGIDLVADRTAALARTNFAASYVSLPGRQKVRQALRVFAELYEVPDPKIAIEEVIELLGITAFADTFCSNLSSGQQTLVLLAKALVNRPAVLFLDEPSAALDPERAVKIRTVLRHVADTHGMTVLITSHNMVEVERLADRVLFIAAGRVVHDATASQLIELFGAENLEDVFLAVAGESARKAVLETAAANREE